MASVEKLLSSGFYLKINTFSYFSLSFLIALVVGGFVLMFSKSIFMVLIAIFLLLPVIVIAYSSGNQSIFVNQSGIVVRTLIGKEAIKWNDIISASIVNRKDFLVYEIKTSQYTRQLPFYINSFFCTNITDFEKAFTDWGNLKLVAEASLTMFKRWSHDEHGYIPTSIIDTIHDPFYGTQSMLTKVIKFVIMAGFMLVLTFLILLWTGVIKK